MSSSILLSIGDGSYGPTLRASHRVNKWRIKDAISIDTGCQEIIEDHSR
jgi:hypothetical protein